MCRQLDFSVTYVGRIGSNELPLFAQAVDEGKDPRASARLRPLDISA